MHAYLLCVYGYVYVFCACVDRYLCVCMHAYRTFINILTRRAQDCIKAGATCVIRVAGGYLKLTDIAFPNGESEPGSAEADGVIKGKHVHGKVNLKGISHSLYPPLSHITAHTSRAKHVQTLSTMRLCHYPYFVAIS